MEARVVNVLVVDDHPIFRQGLVAALSTRDDIHIVADVSSSAQAIEVARTTPIDLAVVDIVMPDTSGITMAADLLEIRPRCAVLGLSVIDEPGVIADFLRTSRGGFALKTQPISEILDAVDRVLSGERYLPPQISCAAVEQELQRETHAMPSQALTRREREVFELLIRGWSNDEIAQQLFIAKRTVETHRYRVMSKLSAHSIIQLQRYAARYGDARG